MSISETPNQPRGISAEMYASSDNIHRLGTFCGLELFYTYVAQGGNSSRATVYLHAVPMHAGEAAFTQVSSVKRELVEGKSERSIERLLIFDATERVKRRIKRRTHGGGEVYTSDLTEADVAGSSRLAA